MAAKLVPVTCPKCGESQNRHPGGFDPDRDPFGPVLCMGCGREFTAHEYRSSLQKSWRAIEARLKSRARPHA